MYLLQTFIQGYWWLVWTVCSRTDTSLVVVTVAHNVGGIIINVLSPAFVSVVLIIRVQQQGSWYFTGLKKKPLNRLNDTIINMIMLLELYLTIFEHLSSLQNILRSRSISGKSWVGYKDIGIWTSLVSDGYL